MWNADLLAGYSLEDRILREVVRRRSRGDVLEVSEPPSPAPLSSDAVTPPEDEAGSGIGDTSAPAELIAAREDPVEEAAPEESPQPLSLEPLADTTHVDSQSILAEVSDSVLPEGNEQALSAVEPQENTGEVVRDIPQGLMVTPTRASESSLVGEDSGSQQDGREPPSEQAIPALEAPKALKPHKAIAAPESPVPTARERQRSTKRRRTPSPSPVRPVEDIDGARNPSQISPVDPSTSASGRLQRSESMTAQQILDSPPTATQSAASEDQAIGGATTGRKLTRGKAIRRSSSGLKMNSQPNSPGLGGRESPLRPLFASSGFDFPASRSPRLSVLDIMTSPGIPETSEVPNEIPESQPEHPATTSSQSDLLEASSSTSRPLRGGRRLGRRPIMHDRSISEPLSNGQEIPQGPSNDQDPSKESNALPPHREAALRRRELPIKRPEETRLAPRPTQQAKLPKPIFAPISGPLIDFSDLNQPMPPVQVHDASLDGLASSSRDLLELLEAEEGPSELPSRNDDQNDKDLTTESSNQHNAEPDTPQKRRPAPPPPVSLRIKRAQEAFGGAPVSRKRSIISTADSPITPRPLHPRNTNEPSPETRAVQAAPTRRPPPPPPPALSGRMVSEPVASGSQAGSSPSPPPPAFLHRPTFEHSHSAFSGASSISDLPELPTKFQPPWPVLSLRPTARPKGPRPPPVPPRPRTTTAWAKIPALNPPPLDLTLAEEDQQSDSIRPIGGRTLSDNPPPGGWTQRSPISAGPARSRSEMDIRGVASTGSAGSADGPRSPLEYTDLDVLVSRLEGSGREYEVSPPLQNRLERREC